MEKDRPFVLPWSSQNQIYGDLSKLGRRFPSLLKNQISTKYKDSNAEYKFGLSNRIESYWDRKIFGQLTSKSGDLRNNQGDELASFDSEGDPTYVYCLKFCPKENSYNMLAMGSEDGVVSIVDTAKRSSVNAEFTAHENAIFDIAWVPRYNDKLISVSGDMTARLWDVSRSSENKIAVFKGHGHVRSVKCIQFKPDFPHEFATGSRENSIYLWDVREPSKPQNTIRDAHAVSNHTKSTPKTPRRNSMRERQNSRDSIGGSCPGKAMTLKQGSVTTLQFQDDNTLISASDIDGIIKVWDLRRSYSLYTGRPKPKFVIPYAGKCALNGYSSLLLDSSRTKLYASCKDHSVYLFDVSQHEKKSPIQTFVGHTNGNKFFVKIGLSPDDRYLVSGSSDGLAYVWNTNLSGSELARKPIATLKGHEAEVTCVEFSKERMNLKLATCSDDFKCKIWRTDRLSTCDKESSGPQILNGEVSWNDEIHPYAFGKRFDCNVCYNGEKVVSIPNRSKRKLFCDMTENEENQCNNSQQGNLFKKRKEEAAGLSNILKCAAYPSSSPTNMSNVLVSPRKVPRGIVQSPKKLNITPKKDKRFSAVKQEIVSYYSPTDGLPNIVKDGRSPHEKSNAFKSLEFGKIMVSNTIRKVDWLTEMSQQKKNALPKKILNKQQVKVGTSLTGDNVSPYFEN